MRHFGLRTTAVALACLALSCAAFAWWSGGGSGSGSGGAAASAAKVSISPGSVSPTLVPNGSASGTVSATVTNPNPYPVHLSQIALDSVGGSSGYSANAAGCALSFATQTNSGSGWDVPASGSLGVTLAGSLTMGTSAADSCQGLTFSVYLVAQ